MVLPVQYPYGQLEVWGWHPAQAMADLDLSATPILQHQKRLSIGSFIFLVCHEFPWIPLSTGRGYRVWSALYHLVHRGAPGICFAGGRLLGFFLANKDELHSWQTP